MATGAAFAPSMSSRAQWAPSQRAREESENKVETPAIHRVIELHAAMQPDAAAIVDARATLSYRELNFRANAFARYLIANGLRRGSHARVDLEPGTELAIALLAILKAGASYEWVEPIDGIPSGRTIVIRGRRVPETSLSESAASQPIHVDDLLATELHASPNLPILTRGSDIACVLRNDDDGSDVLVPHATVVALHRERATADASVGDPGPLDLWVPLMAGATAAMSAQPPAAATAYRAA